MGTSNYSDEFKPDAVHQITVRGYLVREISRRLGGNRTLATPVTSDRKMLAFDFPQAGDTAAAR